MDIRNKSYKPQISEWEYRTFLPAAHTWPSPSVSPDVQLQELLRFLWKRRTIFYSWLIQWKQELSPFVQKSFNAMQLNFIRHILGVRNCIPVGSEIWTSFFNSYLTKTQFCARTVYFSPEYLGLSNIIYTIYLLPISLCYNVNLKRTGLFCSLSYL